LEFVGPEQPEDNPVLAHDHTRVPSGGDDSITDVAQSLTQGARRYVPPDHIDQARALRIRPFGGPGRSDPVLLAVR